MVILEDLELRQARGLVGALQRLADRHFPKLATAWATLAESWPGAVGVEPLARAVAQQNVAAAQAVATRGIMATAPDELVAIQRQLYGSVAEIESFVGAARLHGQATALLRPHLPGLQPVLREASVLWLVERPTPMLTMASEETRRAVGRIVADGLASDRPVLRIANEIRNVIGLSEPHAAAVSALRRRLEATGELGAREIDRAVREYAAKLLQVRAELIAQTEVMRSINAGSDRVWREAADAGLVDLSAVTRIRRTAGDDRVRPEHAAAEGQEVGFFEDFEVDGESVHAPPAAPGCRCTMEFKT